MSSDPVLVTWHRPVKRRSDMCKFPDLPIHPTAMCMAMAQVPDAERSVIGSVIRFSLHGHVRRSGPRPRSQALPVQARFCRGPNGDRPGAPKLAPPGDRNAIHCHERFCHLGIPHLDGKMRYASLAAWAWRRAPRLETRSASSSPPTARRLKSWARTRQIRWPRSSLER